MHHSYYYYGCVNYKKTFVCYVKNDVWGTKGMLLNFVLRYASRARIYTFRGSFACRYFERRVCAKTVCPTHASGQNVLTLVFYNKNVGFRLIFKRWPRKAPPKYREGKNTFNSIHSISSNENAFVFIIL